MGNMQSPMSGRPESLPERLQQALLELRARALQDHRLAAEAFRARREFFGGSGVPPTSSAELRFCEWFLLERESESLGAVPSQAFEAVEDEALLEDSLASVFSVVHAVGETAQLRDLQADEVLDAVAPAGSLRAGDLLVGRLYPADHGQWQPSPAIARFRPGASIAAAFQRDLERLDLDRRLLQVELEHLLLRRDHGSGEVAARDQLEHLEARLEALLRSAGVAIQATSISAALAHAARPGEVVGPLLDQLAFDTSIDLDAARTLLLEIWNARQAGRPTAMEAAPAEADARAGEHLGELLVRTLDAGLAERQDLEQLFRRLEAMAGIAPEEAEENPFDQDEDAIDELPGRDLGDVGDLGPLVQEFLWQTDREHGPVARTLGLFVELQRTAAVPRTDLELIRGEDLSRLLLHVYLGAAPSARGSAVREAFGALQEFYRWLEREQELPLGSVLGECQGMLLDQLDRLQAAGLGLSGEEVQGARAPALLRVVDVSERGIGVQVDDGGELWLHTEAGALLRPGDLLLAATAGHGRNARLSGLVVVLPADAEALIG